MGLCGRLGYPERPGACASVDPASTLTRTRVSAGVSRYAAAMARASSGWSLTPINTAAIASGRSRVRYSPLVSAGHERTAQRTAVPSGGSESRSPAPRISAASRAGSPDAARWRPAAACLVFATFYMRDMMALRTLALCSNLAFIIYRLGLVPIWLLHALLLPVNAWRLWQNASLGSSFESRRRSTRALRGTDPRSRDVIKLDLPRDGVRPGL
jgi:hypothetical protein